MGGRSIMRSRVRVLLAAPLIGAILALVAVSAPAAQAAFGAESFFAGNCKVAAACNEKTAEYFPQAAGHPPAGVTDFTIANRKQTDPPYPVEALVPEGNVKRVRIDVGPGQSTNPEAVPKCSVAEFMGEEVAPGTFTKPECAANTIIGENIVLIAAEVAAGVYANVELEGKLYNIEQPTGLSSYFGVALDLTKAGHPGFFAHTFLEGHIEWGQEAGGTDKGDYHDYYIINNITPGLVKSRTIYYGNIGTGVFLTLPSSCTGTGPQTTTTLHVESYEGQSETNGFSGPVGSEGCKGESGLMIPPFVPGFKLEPETSQSDKPDRSEERAVG